VTFIDGARVSKRRNSVTSPVCKVFSFTGALTISELQPVTLLVGPTGVSAQTSYHHLPTVSESGLFLRHNCKYIAVHVLYSVFERGLVKLVSKFNSKTKQSEVNFES